jgi:hypothetical protein
LSQARLQQQLAHALLAHGVSGEIVPTDAGGLLLVVDDVRQVEAARAVVAAYFPEVTRVIAHAQ